jgi:peptidoglycan/LPS O-acetylase OafA/YrhL/O-antigen/teichoic acid export membrane protein
MMAEHASRVARRGSPPRLSRDVVRTVAPSDARTNNEPTDQQIVRQVKWFGGAQLVADAAFYGTLVVLAALVSPAGFGTVAAGMAIVRVTAIIMEAGTGGSIIATRGLTAEQASKVARTNVVVGALLALCIALAAGPLASTLASGGDADVLRVLALALALQAVGVVPLALLRKAMDFPRFAAITSFSALSTAVVAVVVGLLGADVWALVTRQLVFPLLLAVLAWRAARPIMRSLPRAPAGVRRTPWPGGVSGFLVVGIAGLLAMTLDNIVVGAVTDARQLGFYALSYAIGLAPLTQISWRLGQVLFPAAAATTSLEVVGQRTARAMRLVALVLCPLVAPAIALAPAGVPAVLGSEWAPMVTPFQILLVVGVAHAVANVVAESLSGTGNVGFRARCDAPWAISTVLAVAVLGQSAGIRGAALAHLLMVVPLIGAYAVLGTRRIGTGPREVWRVMRAVLVPVGAQVAVTLGLLAMLRDRPQLTAGAIAAGAGLVTLAVLLALAPSRPLRDLRAVIRLGGRKRDRTASALTASLPAAQQRRASTRPDRLVGIEGLRALAASSIVLLHCWQYSDPAGPVNLGPMNQIALQGLPLGVTLFFTLSGFLLYLPFASAIIRGEPVPSVGRYMRNRALRILPAYWVILLLVALVLQSALVWDHGDHARVAAIDDPSLLIRNLLLVQTYDPHTILTGIGPAWSLAVEAVFYLALPLLVLVAARLARRASTSAGRRTASLAPAAVMLTIGLSGKLVGALVVTRGGGWDPTWHSVIERSFWGQADLFTFGLVIAVVWVEVTDGRIRLPGWWRSGATGAIGLIALTAALLPLGLPAYGYSTLVALAFGLLLALVVVPGSSWASRLVRLLESRPVVATGVISYSLFLWNAPLTRWLAAHHVTLSGPTGLVVNIAMIGAVSWAVSALTYRYIERPALRLKAARGANWSRRSGLAPGQVEVAP